MVRDRCPVPPYRIGRVHRRAKRCGGGRRPALPHSQYSEHVERGGAATMSSSSIPAGARIGHVHLKMADLERSIRFYSDLMRFDLIVKDGDEAAFLSAGGYHHHLG